MPTIAVSRGFTYNYQHFPPSLLDGKYVLFLHGWPSAANEWHNQIDHFRKLGWGVLAPDLLGSGRTSRPTEVDKYVLKDIAKDVVEILDYENISKVNAVGHDWGSTLLSRLAVYHSERIERLCFLTVGYRPPGTPFSLEAANEMAIQKLGHAIFGYQEFFIRNEKSQEILNEHKDSIMSLVYAKDPGLWKAHLALPGALEKYLESDQRVEWATYLTEADHRNHQENTSDELGGIPTLNWYKANGLNLNYEAEKDTTDEQKSLKQKTLLINCLKDEIAVPALQTLAAKPFVPELEVRELNTAHWAHLEVPDAVSTAIEAFFG